MKKIALMFCLLPVAALAESDAEIALKNALNTVKTQCGGISQSMDNLKKMAGIGTTVNAVGTVAGAGGVVSGVVKYKKDVETAEYMMDYIDLEKVKAKLKQAEMTPENQRLLNMQFTVSPNLETNLLKLAEDTTKDAAQKQNAAVAEIEKEQEQLRQNMTKKQEESKTAGNVRTGLFAANTATSVAGAVISSKTGVDADLAERIRACAASVEALTSLNTRVRVEDGANANNVLLQQSQNILNKCGQYEYVDVDSLNKLAKGATISNSIGAVTGSTAVITSALGNKNTMLDIAQNATDKNDAIKKGKQYDTLNLTSNVLGGATAATSLAGTIMNASQIKKVKEVVNISTECEETLK